MSSVNLVWATPNGDQLIGDMARVSNPENQGADPVNLIKYLVREQHWSPFEMVSICFEINTTRTISRQLLRHSPRPQEFSQRYANPNGLADQSIILFETTQARLQHPTNRQMSIPCKSKKLRDWWDYEQERLIDYVDGLYHTALSKGIAKEVARNILPEGMTPTKMYMNGNLRDWLFLARLRSGHGTQLEAVEIAEQIKTHLFEQFPNTAEAFFEES